ncbi:MAG: flagellar export protein FliJ [Treponema sp.]|nr:flagellar export protein FliJ [Treponema sp.]
MKKFKFNLEKILELKKFYEEEAKMALGAAITILNEIENNIKDTARKQHLAASERFKDPAQMIMWNNYIERLEQETEKLMEQAAQAEIVVEEKRTLYMETFKDLKAMEKLKEKKEEEYKKEMDTKESYELDEIFASRQFHS